MNSLAQSSSALRAAIYIRVSTGNQEDNYSPKTQEDACRRYCATREYDVAEEHIFRETFTGADDAFWYRPELTRLRAEIERGALDRAVV